MPTRSSAVASSSISWRTSRGASRVRSAWFHVWSPIAWPSATARWSGSGNSASCAAEREEGRLDVVALQRVEDALRVRARAVVEGQRDAAGLRAGEPDVRRRLQRPRDRGVLERARTLLAQQRRLRAARLLLEAQPRKLGLGAVAERHRVPGPAAAGARRDDDDQQQRDERERGRGDATATAMVLGLRRGAAAAGRLAHRHGGW